MKPQELTARAKARAAQAAAESVTPCELEQIRRDSDAAHRWLESQGKGKAPC